MKILMVCLGNICRSPLAEGILQHMAHQKQLNWQVHSAGTNGYHNGQAPHPLSQKVALLNGIEISNQISQPLKKQHIANYDLIFAMAQDVLEEIKEIAGEQFDNKKIKLFLNEIPTLQNQDVPDPYYGGEAGYHEVFEIIKNACAQIIKNYS
jgi:protein-tyrosine phosphatase